MRPRRKQLVHLYQKYSLTKTLGKFEPHEKSRAELNQVGVSISQSSSSHTVRTISHGFVDETKNRAVSFEHFRRIDANTKRQSLSCT